MPVWQRLEGRDGHQAGRELLAQAYRERFRREMPEIAVSDRGKPYFADGSVHFSISHTQRHVFCVLEDRPVGIDAEEADREINLMLADRILSEGEMARFTAAADKRLALLRLWVLKEALAKLTGQGWGNWLRETDFDPEDSRIRMIDGCLVAVMTEN